VELNPSTLTPSPKSYMKEYMPDDIKKIIQETAKETAKEVRHEFDIVIENLEKGTLKAIREELTTHGQQITDVQKTLDGHTDQLEKIDNRVAAVETTLKGTESEKPLKQRVEDLEEKVSAR